MIVGTGVINTTIFFVAEDCHSVYNNYESIEVDFAIIIYKICSRSFECVMKARKTKNCEG